ncbi:uncharacterized protein LOC142575934 isoform X2 [Dermacentor variabilis]|uniref:uncharacterized protein LOC142575934 isoform X2 n=1 Tax=Dermacentor variabilis TaxID=34621 RepID=UPI003F5B6B79
MFLDADFGHSCSVCDGQLRRQIRHHVALSRQTYASWSATTKTRQSRSEGTAEESYGSSLLVNGTIIDDIEEVFNKVKGNITENISSTKVVPTSLGDLLRKFGIKANVSRCPFEDDLCIVECYNNNSKPLRGHCGGFLWTKCVCEEEYRK